MIDIKEIIKEQAEYSNFEREYNTNKLAQAYLVKGGDKIIRREFINYMICKIFCSETINSPCYKCEKCQQVTSRKNVDICEFGDGSDNLKKEDIEKIVDTVITRPYVNNIKVVVIYNFDKTVEKNQNLLLKILEEIPSYCYVILETNSLLQILPTVKSRCRLLLLNSLTNEQICSLIKENKAMEKIMIASQGNLTNALDFSADKNFEKLFDFAFDFCSSSKLKNLEIMESNKNKLGYLIEILQNVLDYKLKLDIGNEEKIKIIKVLQTVGENLFALNRNTNKNVIIDRIINCI